MNWAKTIRSDACTNSPSLNGSTTCRCSLHKRGNLNDWLSCMLKSNCLHAYLCPSRQSSQCIYRRFVFHTWNLLVLLYIQFIWSLLVPYRTKNSCQIHTCINIFVLSIDSFTMTAIGLAFMPFFFPFFRVWWQWATFCKLFGSFNSIVYFRHKAQTNGEEFCWREYF